MRELVGDGHRRLEVEDLGYNLAIVGQKSYNGVAIASLHKIENVHEGLPGSADDAQTRYLEATIKGIRVARRNENRAASWWRSPATSPPPMVIPEREIPGMNANA